MNLRTELRKISREKGYGHPIFLVKGKNIFFNSESPEDQAEEFFEKISKICKVYAKKDFGVIIKYNYEPMIKYGPLGSQTPYFSVDMLDKVVKKLRKEKIACKYSREMEKISAKEEHSDNKIEKFIHKIEFKLTWF